MDGEMTSSKDEAIEPHTFDDVLGKPSTKHRRAAYLSPVPDPDAPHLASAAVGDADDDEERGDEPPAAPESATYGGGGFCLIEQDGQQVVAQRRPDGSLVIVGPLLGDDAGQRVETYVDVDPNGPVDAVSADPDSAGSDGDVDVVHGVDVETVVAGAGSVDAVPPESQRPTLNDEGDDATATIPAPAPEADDTGTDIDPQPELEPEPEMELEPVVKPRFAAPRLPSLPATYRPAHHAAAPATPPAPQALLTVGAGGPVVGEQAAPTPEPLPPPVFGWSEQSRGWTPLEQARNAIRRPRRRLIGKPKIDPFDTYISEHVRAPIRRRAMFGVGTIKGGAGKTVTSLGLSYALAAERGERVALIDADSDASTVALRVHGHGAPNWWEPLLALERGTFRSILDYPIQVNGVPQYVFPGPNTPEDRAQMTPRQWRDVLSLIAPAFNVVVADTLTGLAVHQLAPTLLQDMSGIALVGNASFDDMETAGATYDYLVDNGHHLLARNAVLVVSMQQPDRGDDTVRALVNDVFFNPNVPRPIKDVVVVPYDPYLSTGSSFTPERIAPATIKAWKQIAAALLSNVT